MIVYIARNLINDKCYVGITKYTLEHRKLTHENAVKYKVNRKFYKALNKYGFDSFEWSVLHQCDSIEQLQMLEIEYIRKYDSFNSGYNLTTGGEHNKEYSAISIQKMSDARVDWHKSNTNGFKGKTHSDESRRKISESAMGRQSPNKGKVLSDSHRSSLSTAQLNWLKDNEHPNRGKNWKHKTKREYVETTCPHCGKVGKSNMTRYHFDKCKHKH